MTKPRQAAVTKVCLALALCTVWESQDADLLACTLVYAQSCVRHEAAAAVPSAQSFTNTLVASLHIC